MQEENEDPIDDDFEFIIRMREDVLLDLIEKRCERFPCGYNINDLENMKSFIRSRRFLREEKWKEKSANTKN